VDDIPAPTSPATTILTDDPAVLKRTWRAVLAELRKVSSSRYPFFSDTQIRLAADGASLLVAFPADSAFKLAQAKKPENAELLARAIRAAFDQEVPFTLEVGAHAASKPVPVPAPEMVPEPPAYEPVPDPVPAPASTDALIPEPELTINDIPDDATEYIEPPASSEDTEFFTLELTEAVEDTPRPAPTQEASTIFDTLGATVIQQINEAPPTAAD
jgi:hypothetical protein